MEQVQPRRRRGRPPGATRYCDADSAVLNRVADNLLREPSMKPTSAIKLQSVKTDAAIRRLQRKWRATGPLFLAAARRREELRRAEAAPSDRMTQFHDLAARFGASGIAAGPIAQIKAALGLNNPNLDAMRAAIEAARAAYSPQREVMVRVIADAQKRSDMMSIALGSVRRANEPESAVAAAIRAQKLIGIGLTAGAFKARRWL